MTINEKLATIQTKFKSKKTSYNAFGKYYFRKAEDILEALKPYLLQLSVSITINEKLIEKEPMPMIESTATIWDGENAIHASAIVGVDLNQKGMQTAQQFGAASSYAKKYALGNLFLIDDTADSDGTNNHGKQSNVVSKIKQAAKTSISEAQMIKATEFCKAGGSVDAIKSKYKLTAAQEKTLNGQTGNTTKA
jgi:hypothetical protein